LRVLSASEVGSSRSETLACPRDDRRPLFGLTLK
jgi:hypothetical protein